MIYRFIDVKNCVCAEMCVRVPKEPASLLFSATLRRILAAVRIQRLILRSCVEKWPCFGVGKWPNLGVGKWPFLGVGKWPASQLWRLQFKIWHTRAQPFVEYCVPLQISPKKFAKHALYVETLRMKNGTDLVSKPINWIWSCALRSLLLPHSSDDCSSKSLRRAFVTPILAITCDYQS